MASKEKIIVDTIRNGFKMCMDTTKTKTTRSGAPHLKSIFEKTKPLSNSEKQELKHVMEKLKVSAKSLKGKSFPILNENFEVKKERLIEELSKVCSKEEIIRLQSAKTPEELSKVLFEQEQSYFTPLNNMLKQNKPRYITLGLEQIVYAARAQKTEMILARERAMHVQSTKPQVIAIENILKEKYRVQFVSLKDDEELAKQTLKAFKIASENGAILPKNVIASDFLMTYGEYLNDTILLATKSAKDFKKFLQNKQGSLLTDRDKSILKRIFGLLNMNQFSTSDDCHVALHEILHGNQPKLLAFNAKKIPKRFANTKQKVSAYSALNGTHETDVELKTKKMLLGLNPDEEELLHYLNYCI